MTAGEALVSDDSGNPPVLQNDDISFCLMLFLAAAEVTINSSFLFSLSPLTAPSPLPVDVSALFNLLYLPSVELVCFSPLAFSFHPSPHSVILDSQQHISVYN